MASSGEDGFTDVEHLRKQLAETVAKLQRSLQTWQIWEAEYEGLKEEILAFDGEPTTEDLIAMGKDFGSTLVDEKEIQTLFQGPLSTKRSQRQVVDVIARRIDYVSKNVEAMEKQLRVAVDRLSSVLAARSPDMQEGNGSPVTEIHEELDEEGRVISSRTSTPGEAAPQIIRALEEAGINEATNGEMQMDTAPTQNDSATESETSNAKQPARIPSERAAGVLKKSNHDKAEATPPKAKKGVRFTEDTKPAEDVKHDLVRRQNKRNSKGRPSGSASKGSQLHNDHLSKEVMTSIIKESFPQSTIASNSRDGNGAAGTTKPLSITPRSQSSTYSTQLVSAATAAQESNATNPASPGHASPPIIPIDESPEDAALRREMLEYTLSEVGAVVAELSLEEGDDDWEDMDVDGDSYQEPSYDSDDDEEDNFGRSTRRGVSDDYARQMAELQRRIEAREIQNIGPDHSATTGLTRTDSSDQTSPPELSLDADATPQDAPNPALASAPITVDIVERAPSRVPEELAPSEPDALDPALHRQEIAVEYHKMRNRMINRQGGFLARDEEQEERPLAEEGGRKVSRFKAARLRG